MAGAFGGPMAAPGGCDCCTSGPPPCNIQFCVVYKKCDGTPSPGDGVTVSIPANISHGAFSYSGTTDANGKFCTPIGIVAGLWTYVITPADSTHYNTVTGTLNIANNCNVQTATEGPRVKPPYCCKACISPAPAVLHDHATVNYSSGVFGSATLTRLPAPDACHWLGTLAYAWPGIAGQCPPETLTLNLEAIVNSSGFRVSVTFNSNCLGFQSVYEGALSDTFSCNEDPLLYTQNYEISHFLGPGAPTDTATWSV